MSQQKKLVKSYLDNQSEFLSTSSKKELEKLVKFALEKYYTLKEPIMNDEEYDMLLDTLKERFSNSKLLKNLNSSSGHILINIVGKKKNLPYHMGSMSKIKPGNGDVLKWSAKYKGPYSWSDKLDGSSGLFTIDEEGNRNLYTRGNGTVGTNLSHLIQYMPTFNKTFPSNISVRGEFIVTKTNFKKYSKKFVNPRSLVNTLATKKNPDPNVLKIIDFVAYELIFPWGTIFEQYTALEKLGFTVAGNGQLDNIDDESLQKLLKTRRENSQYEIDGIIIQDGDTRHLRNTEKNPKYAFAFKDQRQNAIKETTVEEVIWNISMYRKAIPKLRIKPVTIDGFKNEFATAHNAKYIKDNKIGPGTIIKITRSGEIIPYVLKVVKPSKKPSMPENIANMSWNKTGVDLILDQSEYSEQSLVKNIAYFVKNLGIKNLDQGMLTRLVNNDIATIPRLLEMTKDDFLEIDGIKEKMATKLYNNIQNGLKDVELPILMNASNTFEAGLGKRKLSEIIKNYPDIHEKRISKKTVIEKIEALNGFNTITATYFANGLPKFKNFLKTVPMITYQVKKKTSVPKKFTKYKNMKIVFTGFRNKEWEDILSQIGTTVTGTVSKNTNMVVARDIDDAGSKLTKAKKLNIPIVEMSKFA